MNYKISDTGCFSVLKQFAYTRKLKKYSQVVKKTVSKKTVCMRITFIHTSHFTLLRVYDLILILLYKTINNGKAIEINAYL